MSQSFHQTGGWIEVISGVMFSGKSEELIRRVRRSIIARKRVQVFKSHLDARYAGIYSISSHDGRTVEAIPADSAAQIASEDRSDGAGDRDRRGAVSRRRSDPARDFARRPRRAASSSPERTPIFGASRSDMPH